MNLDNARKVSVNISKQKEKEIQNTLFGDSKDVHNKNNTSSFKDSNGMQ